MADKKTAPKGRFAALILRDGDTVLGDRGKRAIESASAAQKTLVMNLEEEIRQLEDKQEAMLDQSPDNRYSLKIGESFDSKKFVGDYQKISLDLLNKKVELDVAKKNLKDLFGE